MNDSHLRRKAPGHVARPALAVLILSLNFGIVFFDRNAIGFLVPFIQSDLKMSSSQIGMLAAVLALTWAISGYVIGHFADHHGRRKLIIIISTTIFSFSSFITGVTWSFATLLVARLLMGLAEGGVMPVSQSLTADIVPEHRRGLAMGVMQAFGSNLLGGMIAPLLLVGLAGHYGWRTTFYMTALPGLACVLLMTWLVPDASVSSSRAEALDEPGGVMRLLRGNVLLCCLISVCLVAYNSICWYFVPLFLTETKGMAPQAMSWLIATLGFSAVVTAFTIPALSDKWGRRPVMILFTLVGLIMPLSAIILPPVFWRLSPWFFVGWTVLGVYPIFMSIIPVETVGKRDAAKVLGLVVGAGELFGGVLGPIVAGVAADMTDHTAPLWIMALLTAMSAVLSLALTETAPAKTRSGSRLSDIPGEAEVVP